MLVWICQRPWWAGERRNVGKAGSAAHQSFTPQFPHGHEGHRPALPFSHLLSGACKLIMQVYPFAVASAYQPFPVKFGQSIP
jgi:hypothetical protein